MVISTQLLAIRGEKFTCRLAEEGSPVAHTSAGEYYQTYPFNMQMDSGLGVTSCPSTTLLM